MSSTITAGSAEEDRAILATLYHATDGKSWKKKSGWNMNADFGDWHGVSVDVDNRVVGLELSFNNLRGKIPRELGNLQTVKELYLNKNALTGEIPKELGGLPALKGLYLGENKLSGAIPKELGGLPALKTLHLAGNQLSGEIPKELGNLQTVEAIYLYSNALTGEIPKELGGLPVLKTLDLRWNELSGEIPKELGGLPALKTLHLAGNKLSGEIPKELGNLQTVEAISLYSNALTELPLALLQEKRKRKDFITLNVNANPFQRPPKTVVELGVDQAISWWKDIERFGEGTSNKQLKMVLVGLAEVGKTTVVRNLTGKTFPKVLDRTVGIEITDGWKPIEGGPLEISIWDFAGQADYYASHQIFLTKGSLFLLVVDLQALLREAAVEVEKGGDPHGRVHRWLDMLHLRVPGAAVALVGTHCDADEFEEDPDQLKRAVSRLEQLVASYLEDKAEEVETAEAMLEKGGLAPNDEIGTMQRDVLFDRQRSSFKAPPPLFIHEKVFTTSLNRDSVNDLREWVKNAATLDNCPTGFEFPAVSAKIPLVWIDANTAMHGLTAGDAGKRFVTWREAVQTFGYFMETKGTPVPDPEEILLRAMRHREAEGGVLLSLEHDSPRLGESAGMLYLDPTWLIEVIRRLTDHNLVDTTNQDKLKKELEEYGKQHIPPLDLNSLWAQHRSYRSSGTLDLPYLRFLWLHRELDNAPKLQLNHDEFNSVLVTLEALLVLYRAPATEGTNRALFVVPARLPEYGNEQVLEKGNLGLGDAVVRTRCSFRRSYAPPGLIGRFLAFANAHIKEARECWQHGAHLIWTPGYHDVLVYETQHVERSDGVGVAYPGLVLCVKGCSPAARGVLDSLTDEVRSLLTDKVHGYPGLCSVVFEGTDEVVVSDLTSDLRTLLENRFDQLDALVGKVARVTEGVLEAIYLAAEEDNKYPRLLVLKPESDRQPGAAPVQPTTPVPPTSVSSAGGNEGNGGAAAAEGMQRETWDRWIKALTEGRKFRMIFICEHDMTEVKCGPGGDGYLIEDLAGWVKVCLPVLQVSLYALRVAVGMVAHVDLPLYDVVAALVNYASTEVLGAMPTGISAGGQTQATLLPTESTMGEVPPQKLQEEGYAALCHFMHEVESHFMHEVENPMSCCGRRFKFFTCGSGTPVDPTYVNWRDEMVRVRNGKGGVVWVKKANEVAYSDKITAETGR